MFTTWDGEKQRARHMSARVERDEHSIYFLADMAGEKNTQIEHFPDVRLTLTDSSSHKYVTISGPAAVSDNREKISELWTETDKAWWDSEDDPNIRLLTVRPQDAEIWDGPSGAVATVKMLFAALTGAKPNFG